MWCWGTLACERRLCSQAQDTVESLTPDAALKMPRLDHPSQAYIALVIFVAATASGRACYYTVLRLLRFVPPRHRLCNGHLTCLPQLVCRFDSTFRGRLFNGLASDFLPYDCFFLTVRDCC